MSTRNITLTDNDDQFIDVLISSGRYSDANEVMRAGLCLLEEKAHQEDEKMAVLRSLASKAFNELDQGQGIVLDDDRQLADYLGRIGCRAAEELEHRTING